MRRECRMMNAECRMGILFAGILLCGSVQAATVMCDSNGVVYHPDNFWVVSGAEEMMMDIAEATADTHVAGLLSDYYTASQSDARYMQYGAGSYARNVQVDRTNLATVTGYDVQSCLDSIDALITNLAAQITSVSTNSTNTIISTSGSTNATDIRVAFTPSNYTPATNSVESHLIAINSMLGYILGLATNASPPATNIYLTGLTLTGNNLVYERSTNRYYVTATYSDASSRDVSGDSVYSLVGGPATAQMTGTNLVVGSITWHTSVTVNAEYSWNGASLARSTLVQINDTNPPTLQRVDILGGTSAGERTPANYTAYAVYDQGVSNNVSASCVWGFSTAYPPGTAWTGNTLYAGSTITNYSIGITAQYGGLTGNTNVWIVNTEQHLLITLNNAQPYYSGTMYIYGWDNRYMQGWPTWSWSFPYSSGMYGTYATNVLSTSIRQVGSGQFSGATYWFAFLDTDGNGYPNGTLSMGTDIPQLRTDEPATIMDGQTATDGRNLSANTAASLAFTLDGSPSTYAVQPCPAIIGYPRRLVHVVASGSDGAPLMLRTVLTNRVFVCEQDFLLGSVELSAAMGSHRIYVWGQQENGNVVYPSHAGFFNLP